MAADRDLRIKITAEADTSAVDKETDALKKLTASAVQAKSAVEQLGKAKPASGDDWVQEQLRQTRRMADDLGSQRQGVGSATGDAPASTAKDYDAMAAGMRAAKGDGEGLIGMVGRLGGGLTVARVALLGFVGLLAGGTLGAIAGFVGWISKGAAATPQFQAGLERLRDATRGVGDELNRTAAPLTNFLGAASGSAMEALAGAIDNTRATLRGFNDAASEAERRNAAADDATLAYAAAAANLKANLEGVANQLRATNTELAENERRAKAATAAANTQTEANTKLKISQIDIAEASGKVTPEEADRQRLAARGAGQAEVDQRSVDAADRQLAAVSPAAVTARQAENAAAEKVADLEEKLKRAQAAPRESLAETRQRLEREAKAAASAGGLGRDFTPVAVTDDAVQTANNKVNTAPNAAINAFKIQLAGARGEQVKATAEAKKTGDALIAAKDAAALLKTTLEANKAGNTADAAKLDKKQAEDTAKEKIEADKKATEAKISGLEKAARLARTLQETELLNLRQTGATADQTSSTLPRSTPRATGPPVGSPACPQAACLVRRSFLSLEMAAVKARSASISEWMESKSEKAVKMTTFIEKGIASTLSTRRTLALAPHCQSRQPSPIAQLRKRRRRRPKIPSPLNQTPAATSQNESRRLSRLAMPSGRRSLPQ